MFIDGFERLKPSFIAGMFFGGFRVSGTIKRQTDANGGVFIREGAGEEDGVGVGLLDC